LSHKKKPRRRPPRRVTIARLDGERIELDACCPIVAELGAINVRIFHDDGCSATAEPSTDAGQIARARATFAVRAELDRRGIASLVVMSTGGELAPALVLLDREGRP